ncbi:GNAT family N-acetyltransferase [Saccharothrix variisporea]|uniref:RimJ/RimL family protein N-acetyltransferase n=1 Tax=Saccharothrix variisporea TaxID=543527 RepID=A0A495XHA7_9PSEU|nr:GNAT family N-acetyltransferase [Saccharothrix variisporea]RKT71933.1 RimJ/RimL family protein N-acetyltransferase [Saccharothrix variisporea]
MISTDRLDLPAWTDADLAAIAAGAHLPHWAEDFPADGDRVIAGLLADQPRWRGEFGHRLLVERATGLVVGSLGLFWPPVEGRLEIGYGVVPSRQGLGYATEATSALTAHALTAPGVTTVHAGVEPTNPASVRVLEKAGFRLVETGEVHRYEFGA